MPGKKRSGRKAAGSGRSSVRGRVALTLHSLRGMTDAPPSAWRAVCARGDFVGPERAKRSAATQDALDHQDGQPSHKVEVLAVQ